MKTLTPEQFKAQYGVDAVNQVNSVTRTDKRPGFFASTAEAIKDIPSDIVQTAQGVKSAFQQGVATADTAREQVTQGEISPMAGTVKTIGGGLRAGAEAVGETVMGLLRLPFSPTVEQKTAGVVEAGAQKIADTELVQSAVQKYESLSPEQKAIVDGVLGTTEGLATMLGAGPAVKATKAAVDLPVNAIERGIKSIDDIKINMPEVSVPSVQGIELARKAGLAPEDLMQRVARISKGKQAKFQELSGGESVGEYLVKRDIFGNPDQIVDQLYTRYKDSMGRVDRSIATVQGEFKAPQVQTALDDLIQRDVKVSTEGAKSPDSVRIEQLYKKYNQQGLTLSEVNEVKRLYERNVKVDYLTIGAPSDKLARATNIDSALRNLVADKAEKAGVATVKELNKETQLARQLVDDIGAEYAGSAGNNAIGLTDSIFLAEVIGSGNPLAAAGFIAKKGLGSKTVMSKIAKAMSQDAGSKAKLPEVPESDKLTGYLKYLDEQSKKAQSATTKTTDLQRFEKAKNLSEEDRQIEMRAFERILNSEADIISDYENRFGKVVNTDNFRQYFTEDGYAGYNSASVQEPSSYLSKRVFSDQLKNPEPFATFLAGGSGTGKTSAVKNLPEVTETMRESAVILDSNLSSINSAIKKIQEANDAGKAVVIDYVYRDPVDSFENGVVKRMLTNESEGGRLVPSKVVAENHIDSWDVVRQLEDMGVEVNYIDNSLGAGKARIADRTSLEAKIKYGSKEELTKRFNEVAKRLLEEGKITKNQYEGYIK